MRDIIIAESDSETLERIRVVALDECEAGCRAVSGANAAVKACESVGAALIVLGPSVTLEEALALASEVTVGAHGPEVIYMALYVDTDTLRRAMRAGLRDVVTAGDESLGELRSSIHEALATVRLRPGDSDPEGPAPQTDAARVVTVFSTKGGVGKSVIASNLGVALAAEGLRVVLVDLDLQFGDAGIMLSIEPRHTILDAVQALDRLDADMLGGFLSDHPSGLRVLLAPIRPEDSEVVTTTRVADVISLLKTMADVVILDTPGLLDETVLTAIDKSDTVLAVATMDLASIKNTRISLQKLRQLGYRNGLVRLVLNRADSKVLLEESEVEKAIGAKIKARIPSDRTVPRSVNKGVPVVLDAPRSQVSRSLSALAHDIMTHKEVETDVT